MLTGDHATVFGAKYPSSFPWGREDRSSGLKPRARPRFPDHTGRRENGVNGRGSVQEEYLYGVAVAWLARTGFLVSMPVPSPAAWQKAEDLLPSLFFFFVS